ncbi:HAMP domain-containing sensor histidine kinase [Streptomyces sp. SID3343]|uniref:sensor histidine kinase n=1 Tax=Streptomyces sp. SID3343 TaxID=2690260 RepID=UPI001368CD36|nr:HAMP domain-containing sensor histidine kinase [Streptomyces sp. SID3343]MYW03153.1 HAMP domain-containing protein [Streptomyces sp. SID3343]
MRRMRLAHPGRLSLRVRVLIIATALVAVALLVSETVVVGSLRGYLTDQVDRQLEQAARGLAFRPPEAQGEQRPGPSGNRPHAPGVLPSRIVAEYLAPDGTTSQRLRTGAEQEFRPSLPHLDTAAVQVRGNRAFETDSVSGETRWRVLAVPLRGGEGSVVLAEPLDDVHATVDRMRSVCLVIGTTCLAVLAAAGWFALRGGLRPLRRIEETAAAIAAGDLSHRVPVVAPGTEIGRLSASLNGMLAQIETAFAARAESETRMRRFVADAGHELRTPLASVRGFAELYRMGALTDPAEVARTMRRIEDEALRMGGLVEDLLQLARLDEQRPLCSEPVDLRILSADAVHDIKTLAPDRPVTLTGLDGGPARPVTVSGDEARLRQVVANLVSNALTHTPAGTAIRIAVGHAGPVGTPCAALEVADAGPGLTLADAQRVFERFYRVDSSRSRAAGGGSGLGLAIVAALVNAHAGRVEVRTAPGEGASFRVLLPVPEYGHPAPSTRTTLGRADGPRS